MTNAELKMLTEGIVPLAPGHLTYIYALVDPETGEIRYIGKSIRPIERHRNHINEPPSNCHRSHWLQSLKARGLEPELIILECVNGAWPWQEAERFWIAYGRRHGWRLTNNTSGGDGVPNLPPETRARMRRVWLGRKHRPESLEKLRVARRRYRATDETRRKMSASQKGRTITWGAKLGAANRKFDASKIAEVRRRLASGERVTQLAAEFDVHRTTISKIKKGTYMTTNVIGQAHADMWTLYNGDCVEVLRGLPNESIHFSIFSPPYLSLYVYSASDRDIGNAATDAEFWTHFGFVIDELARVMRAGRIVAVDCMNVPAMKERDGYIGLKDFRGDIIRAFIARGFIFHSEHCLWKDPLTEATRTKALGLMHKQLCKDSAMSRAGLPQYLLAFRKQGANSEAIAHPHGLESFFGEDPPTEGNLSHERWRRYASPVWDDIDFTNTLNARAARDEQDERHVCPMALDAINRALHLWSKEGDVVLSPFAGIGSEGYAALQQGRRFVGVELKKSYFTQAVTNLQSAARASSAQTDLFARGA